MKKLCLLILLMMPLASCYFSETREKQKPVVNELENHRKYFLRESIVQFPLFTYNVWDFESFEFDDMMTKRETRLYNIRQKAALGENIYIIRNLVEDKKEYVLKEDFIHPNKLDLTYYSIYLDENDASSDKLVSLSQIFADDNFNFKVEMGGKTYRINKTNEMLNSPVGTVRNIAFALTDEEGTVYCYFLKKFSFNFNQYEIVINTDNILEKDGFYITLCIFVDQVLKENNYYYKYY